MNDKPVKVEIKIEKPDGIGNNWVLLTVSWAVSLTVVLFAGAKNSKDADNTRKSTRLLQNSKMGKFINHVENAGLKRYTKRKRSDAGSDVETEKPKKAFGTISKLIIFMIFIGFWNFPVRCAIY